MTTFAGRNQVMPPAYVINELITHLAQKQAQFTRRRADARYALDRVLNLVYQRDNDVENLQAVYGVDISLQGMCILTKQPLLEGKQVTIDLSDAIRKSCRLKGIVRFSKNIFSDLYRVGIEFDLDTTD